MTKKKWIYILSIIVLALPVLFFYNALNGNPVSKQLSKSKINNYLENEYPDDEFKLSKPFYNFKDTGYNYTVSKIGDPNQLEYEFIVTGFLGSQIHYDGIYYANQDTPLIERLGTEASGEMTTLLQKSVPEVLEVNVQLEVLKGKYDINTVWNKEFKPEKPMYIHITIDTRKLSKEEVLTAAEIIQKTLYESGYAYRDATINANNLSEEIINDDEPVWYVKYVVSFNKDTELKLKDVEAVQ